MLEGIVEQDDIDITVFRIAIGEFKDALYSLFIYSHGDIWEFMLHLERFVSDVVHVCVLVGNDEAVALPLIAAAEDGHFHLLLQEKAYEVLHVWGLASAPHRDVSYCNDWSLECATLPQFHIEEEIAEADTDTVEPAQRRQPFIDFNEVAFQDCLFDFQLIRETCLKTASLHVAVQLCKRLVEITEYLA